MSRFDRSGVIEKIRDNTGYWNQIETFIHEHSQAESTHSICPECMRQLYPGLRAGLEIGSANE